MSDFEERMSRLSPRQLQICEILVDEPKLTLRGASNRLGMSYHTLNNHMRKIYEKTGVNDKTTLIVNLIRSGIEMEA